MFQAQMPHDPWATTWST